MTTRLFLLAAAVALAGCGGARAFQPPDPLDEPAAYVVFELPDGYEVLDIRYDGALTGDALVRQATVQVHARHRDTGAQALLVYDPQRPRQGPTTVIELRPAERAER